MDIVNVTGRMAEVILSPEEVVTLRELIAQASKARSEESGSALLERLNTQFTAIADEVQRALI